MRISRKSRISRRKFIGLASGTLALASAPLAARTFAADGGPRSFGGLTPNRDFYVTSYGGTPRVDPREWRLKIHGLVEHPLTLTLADIQQLKPVRQTLTLECIGNPPDGDSIGNAEWTGTMLKPLLERAGVQPGAVYAAMRAADGYSTGVPLAEIMREENWLPYLMNGAPLPAEHGYPVRIFIPGKYGMKQPKWITEIEFVDRPYLGYWEQRGWSNEAWRKVNSGFFSPRPAGGIFDILSLDNAARVKAPVDLIGWALAGPSGIHRVEISTDNGASWHPAELVENRSPYIWTVWKYHFSPGTPGDYTVRVRATDGSGLTQNDHSYENGAGATAQPRMRVKVI
ncbi:MAG TPA: molybdopterin-dependent oxidoreductase [Candidatus Binataceae bacterium]|nr:molybdopterin-dependent oxidoreductase [Candidatus Binataceae bacterium]